MKEGQIYKTKFLKYIMAITYIDPFIEAEISNTLSTASTKGD